ncbi:response regulator [Roseivirga sp. BDSF3-8]|uniref:response regulator transcription factor n=1 Tax=Roseivirga sp. BDSF3-8 TaxID=3241598 RepID=UPI003531A725
MNKPMIISVALADDHALFREGLTSLIHKMQGIELVISVQNGQELIDSLPDIEADVVLLDLEMEVMDGIETTRLILQRHPHLRILILTMHDEERMISGLLEAGAHGYLVKNTEAEELEKAIREVYTKGYYVNDQSTLAMLASIRNKTRSVPTLRKQVGLTSRELEVLQLICREMNTQEIAETLFISPRTVEGHRQNLMGKLDVKNTAGLVIKAIREKIIIP